MKALLDFVPVLVFFTAYKLHGIVGGTEKEALFFATPVLMVATVVQMSILYYLERRLTVLNKLVLGMVLVFGTATLVLHDQRFLMWKPTVLYVLITLTLALSAWWKKRNLLKVLLQSKIELPDRVWHGLNLAWIGFAIFMASSNAYVAALYDINTWINFKLWGYIFPAVFFIGQGIYIYPHLPKEADAQNTPENLNASTASSINATSSNPIPSSTTSTNDTPTA